MGKGTSNILKMYRNSYFFFFSLYSLPYPQAILWWESPWKLMEAKFWGRGPLPSDQWRELWFHESEDNHCCFTAVSNLPNLGPKHVHSGRCAQESGVTKIPDFWLRNKKRSHWESESTGGTAGREELRKVIFEFLDLLLSCAYMNPILFSIPKTWKLKEQTTSQDWDPLGDPHVG